MGFLTPTVLNKNPTTQLHISVAEFKGNTRLDVREYKKFGGNKDFLPTKSGVSIPQELFDAFMEACAKHGKELPARVIDVENGIYHVIGKTVEDAMFHKKRIFKSVEEAKECKPPNGYSLFKVKITKGVVIKQKCLFDRKLGKWKENKE